MKILEKDPPLAQECTRPWILVSFLYPLSSAGLTHIAIFTFGPTLLILLQMYVLRYVVFGSLIFLFIFTLFVGYGIYFLTFCIFDSSKASTKAQQIPKMYFPDKWEVLRQYFLIFASAAICFWPVGGYFAYFRRIDLWFWILSGTGLFFFPMALLSAILFDSINELNPIFLLVSIFKTFIGYIGLFLFFCIIGGFMIFVLPAPNLLGFIGHALRFYLLMVLANRLGWFYWWHKGKLGWGI